MSNAAESIAAKAESSQAEISAAAERYLLGAILTDPDRFRDVVVSSNDFLVSAHRLIYRTMAAMNEDGNRIEPALLCLELQSRGELETVGGHTYVAGLLDGAVPESAKEYAAKIQEAAQKRRFINALDIAKSRAVDGHTPEDVLAGLRKELSDHPTAETLGHTYEETVNAPAVSFAIDGFLQEQGVTLIGGLSGHGKTLIMLAMVRALLEGSKLFNHFAVNVASKRVIYLIPESGLSPFAHRLNIFHLADYVRSGRLIYRTLSKKPVRLDHPLLLREVSGADVFLDTVTRFKAGDENDAAENNEFAESLFKLQRAGARTITGAHHSPKSFGRDTFMSLENVLRGTGDIGAMLCTCWGIRQIDAEKNLIFVQNVKPRDFQPCEPFIIQGRPTLDARGYFELTEPPGFAGELVDHILRRKCGRPSIDEMTKAQARRLRSEGKSDRQIAKTLGISPTTVGNWLGKSAELQ